MTWYVQVQVEDNDRLDHHDRTAAPMPPVQGAPMVSCARLMHGLGCQIEVAAAFLAHTLVPWCQAGL